MTEQEWLESPNAVEMVNHLWRQRVCRVTARKLRLLACACPRRIWPRLSVEGRHLVEIAKLQADGLRSAADLAAVRLPYISHQDSYQHAPYYAVFCATGPGVELRGCMESVLAYSVYSVRARVNDEHGYDAFIGTKACSESVAQSCLVREVFRYPFRPLSVELAWLTANVVGIARLIYADRAFDRLPILADALEDAGCTNADILNHCRQPGEHVRGCWAVETMPRPSGWTAARHGGKRV